MVALLSGLVLLPLLVGCPVLLVARRAAPARRYAGLATTAVAFACSIGLLFLGERDVQLPVVWLPGSGFWSLHIGGVGLYALVATVGSALVASIAARASGMDFAPELDAMLLIALSSSNLAFLSGHFLGRYLALEIVGLCIAAAVLTQPRSEAGVGSAGFVYLLLRIGDAGLMAAILMLLDVSGTLVVGDALQAGLGLEGARQAWVVVGFVLAVWVKAGVWPFHDWQIVGETLPAPVGAWLYGILMPQLGLYLLYRVTPLMAAMGWTGRLVMIALSLGSAIVAGVLLVRGRATRYAVRVYGGAILGAVAIATATAGLASWVGLLLVVTTPLRLWAWLGGARHVPGRAMSGARLPDVILALRDSVEQGVLGRGPFQVAQAVTEGARRLQHSVEQGVLGQGPFRVAQAVTEGARRLQHRVEHGLLDQGWAATSRAVGNSARRLQRMVEQGGLESLLYGTTRGTLALGRRVQRAHTGRLRMGLAWVVLTLVIAVLVARR